MADTWYDQLKAEVLDPGLETQCGTCVGLSNGLLRYEEWNGELRVVRTGKEGLLPRAAYDACPGRWCNYPALNRFTFGELPQNWLCGVVRKSYAGHAADENIRRAGASGGVITALLLHLLGQKRITGAICLRMGKQQPWRAEPVIARTAEEVRACSGSVYSTTPTNTILENLAGEKGPLAYVGLPDQVAAIRKLQQAGHPSVRSIAYVFGPYMGTQMSFDAIRSILRAHNVPSEEEITALQYRTGEWPGHLAITLRDGRTIRVEKFHYNYLIPFFITKSSLQLVDFTNELADISIGDAWSPRYEAQRGGHSVILARSARGQALLQEACAQGKLVLTEIPLDEALDMHGHMLDFKKRGAFIRNGWRNVQPEYGYEPITIPVSRIAVEWCLWCFFIVGKTTGARKLLEYIPLWCLGPTFNAMRKGWKNLSKPTKRKGLRTIQFRVEKA